MLSFQIVNEGRAVQICCDDEGQKVLICALRKVQGDHVHLLGPSFTKRNSELSETTPFGEEALSEVIITHGGD